MSDHRLASSQLEPLVLLGVPGFVAAVAVIALVLFGRTAAPVAGPVAQAPEAAEQPLPTATPSRAPNAHWPAIATPWPPVDTAPPGLGDTSPAQASPSATDDRVAAVEPTASATEVETEAAAAPSAPGVLSQPAWRLFSEPRHGYSLELPATWRETGVAVVGVTFGVTHTSASFVDPESEARLMITVWDGAPRPGVRDWPTAIEPNMLSVNGRRPVNGMVAGRPALVSWSPHGDAGRPTYAVFFSREGKYYRVHFVVGNDAASLGALHRALVTLQWDGRKGLTMIPPLPRPTSSP